MNKNPPGIQMQEVISTVEELVPELKTKVDNFRAGSINQSINLWKDITSDYSIIDTVSGLSLEFDGEPPISSTLVQQKFNTEEHKFVASEINRLISKGIVVVSEHEVEEFISPIFVTPKSDGGFRLILNLKRLNEHMPYIHFKMDTIDKFLNLIRKDMFMSKIDLKDAYYSVQINKKHQRFLKFYFDGILYKFICLPNGLCSGPRKFTKLLKPALAYLRTTELMLISAYIDDIITANKSFDICFRNVMKIINLFGHLGFIIHPEKSVFVPSQIIEYLGMVINSKNMTISLTLKKKEKIFDLCKKLLSEERCLIRDIAKLLGYMSFGFIAVKFGKMHYRNLEHVKVHALSISKGNFDAFTELTDKSRNDIRWWRDNIQNSYDDIYKGSPREVLTTDACPTGWGAVTKYAKTNGLFSAEEQSTHINILELKAVLFGLQSLMSEVKNSHLKILCDNTTAVGCINNMGSCKSSGCNDVATEIWEWAICRNNWVIASHIPGIENEEADTESRKNETRLEWKLRERILTDIIKHFQFYPEVDLFASRINAQFDTFVSFRPDPQATHINAFTIDWTSLKFYAFPPFSCINKVIQKMLHENCKGILIVPNWPNQPWFPHVYNLQVTEPYFISYSQDMLYLPTNPQEQHPLHMDLLACLLDSQRGQ